MQNLYSSHVITTRIGQCWCWPLVTLTWRVFFYHRTFDLLCRHLWEKQSCMDSQRWLLFIHSFRFPILIVISYKYSTVVTLPDPTLCLNRRTRMMGSSLNISLEINPMFVLVTILYVSISLFSGGGYFWWSGFLRPGSCSRFVQILAHHFIFWFLSWIIDLIQSVRGWCWNRFFCKVRVRLQATHCLPLS